MLNALLDISESPDPFGGQTPSAPSQSPDITKSPDPFANLSKAKPVKEDKAAVLRRLSQEEGITDPTPLLAIGNQELGNSMKATVSGAGAVGGMQVLPATGLRYVTPQEWATDEGKMRAGVRYYKDLLKKFNGNEQQAIAGYFTGQGNVSKAVAQGSNLPNTLDPISNLRTPQYVNQVQQKIEKNIPDDVKNSPDPFATDDDIKASPDPFATGKTVNVGAPGRNVGPAMTPDQLAVAEPWRKPSGVPSYQQVTPEAAARGIARGVQDNGLRTEYENLALNADVQKGLQAHAPRLAELEAKQAASEGVHAGTKFGDVPDRLTDVERRELASLQQERTNAQEAYQKQIAPQRSQDLLNAQSVTGAHRWDALAAFVQKHGPLTDNERKEIGAPTDYLTKLNVEFGTGLYAKGADLISGVLRGADYVVKHGLTGETPDEFLQKAADKVQASKQLSEALRQVGGAQDESGLYYAGGVAARTAGELTPTLIGATLAPELGLPQTLLGESIYWGGTSALEGIGRKESAGQIAQGVAQNLIPIFGARAIGKIAAGGALAQFSQRVLGNAALNATISAAQGGDFHANLTAAIMGGFMGIGGHESIPDEIIRKVVTDPDVQSGVADILAKPKLFKQAYPKVDAKLKEAGLTDEQASQFVDNLKSASSQPASATEDAQGTTTTPEDLAKESNNAEEIRSNQGQANQQGTTDTAGQNVGRENIQQRAETGTSAGDTQNQIAPINEFEAPPKVSNGPIQNKSILEAVRALGRIQVDDETVEGGELRQFGNKEQKGQGLIGPNGKLKPDTMREYLEEAGFRDPNSTEAPGTPGSLSLDGMYELMDREQRRDKVYSAHRDSNFVDADLAKEYEQHRKSGNEDAQFGHEAGLEDEWRNPDSPLRQAYERIISGDDANGDEFVPVAKQYGISPESIEEHIQRATRTRESLPPVEVTPGGNDGRSEVAPEEGRITGIKNEITDRERAERGLSPIEKDIYDEFPKVFDDVKRGIDSGKIDIRELTREWAEHPKALSENEEAALIYDRARLYNNKEEIIDEITSAIASGDKAAEVEARVRLAPIEDAIVANEKAAVRSGTIWGRSGAMRQQMMKADYSLANIERRFRAKTGDSPTAEQSAKFKKLSEDLEDAQRAIAKRDDIISDLEAQRWTKTEARKEAASGRRVKRAGSLDAIKKEWDGQKDALVRLLKLQGIGEPPAGGKKGLGGPEAGAVDPNLVALPADVAKLLIEMARNRIRAGVTDANEIVDSIHEFVKDKFDVSVRQISDAISGYGKQSKLSTDEVEVQLREVKRIRRLMSALEDAQKGEAPQRSGLKRDKPTRLVRELTRQVNEALRKNGYKLESADRSPEEQYQSALDGIKTRLRNQIEDIDKQIEAGAKSDNTKTPIPLDEEAQSLKAERDAKKAILDRLEGPRETTDEQRAVAKKNALRKEIDAIDRRNGGEVAPEKPSRTTNYDDETHALMAERDMLRRQLQDPTAKNKEAVRKRLVEAERKLSQNDLSRKEAEYPSSIYDDAETKGLKKQLQATNKQIADARALPDKIAKLEAQKAEVIRRLRERDFSKPERPDVQPRNVAPEIARRQAELKDLNKQLATAKAEQNRVEAIQKRNAELRRRIREKDFTPAAKTPSKPVSDRVAQEQAKRAALQKEYDALKPTTNAERNAATEKALEKSIADNEQRIADKRLMPDGKSEPADSPRIQELRKRNEEVKKSLEDLRKADPAVLAAREAAALKTYHKQLATREADMTKTLTDIKAGTYEPRAKRTQRNDPVSVEARARAGRIQDEIEKELLKAQLAKRNWTDKALDFAVKWRRNMLLSNPLTLAKLATAAASRVVVSPVEEAVGGIISHLPIASKIAAKAPREGGFSVAAEARAIYGYTRQLMQFAEAREIVKTGKTRLDTIYGAKGDLPPEAIEFFGRLHKLMKAPAQAAEFARSYQKRVEWALNNKMDPTDPVTQAALASSAYLDAQRAILMQDNAAVTYYRQVISRMRALDSTGKAAHPGYARALEMLLPIVKVPTNFVTETANYSLGLANALLKFRRAGWDANKLTPDEADSIMRSLKKQFVGQALFWMGYGFAGSVGGYYQQGEKRKPGAPGAGEVQLFGHNIPHWLLHSPAMEVMQLGATFRHVMDAHADYSTLGKLGSGALAGVAGLSQQVPFIETPATIADAAKSDRKFGKFAANTVGGMVVPPVVKKIAEFQDSGVKRKPGSVGEDIEMMIPATRFNQGLSRKAVPTEEQRKDEQKQKRDDKKMNPDADKIYENRMKRKGLSP